MHNGHNAITTAFLPLASGAKNYKRKQLTSKYQFIEQKTIELINNNADTFHNEPSLTIYQYIDIHSINSLQNNKISA